MSTSKITQRKGKLPVIMTTGFLLVMAVYFAFPVWWLVVASTKTTGDIAKTNGLWFSFANFNLWENLKNVFSADSGVYWRWIVNAALYAGVGALVGTLLAAMAGFALAKYRFAGRGTVFNIILAAVMIPAPLLVLPLYLMFSKVGLVNTFWAVFLPSIVSPFGVYMSRMFAAASVPDELMEAARVDGSGEYRFFFSMALRIMSPALVTIYLFLFVGIWNNFLLPQVMLNDNNLWPITVGVAYWRSIPDNPAYNQLAIAGSLVAAIPLLIAFICLQRFWRSGLTAGAVKA